MLGNGEKPTDEQIASVKNLRDYLHTEYGNAQTIKGHKDFNSTDCPGTVIYKLIQEGVFSVSSGPRDLGLGDEGKDVEGVQTALNAYGYKPKLKVDGSYGPKTVLGVKWFQRKNNLSPDGIVGKETRAALFQSK
jgi:N-acetyl-anhydromuramyl-L-alanine amidase AmpD